LWQQDQKEGAMTMSVVADAGEGRNVPGPHSHAVQFYEKEEFLFGVVADFLAEGFSGNEAAVVIATPQHLDAFASHLSARGHDVEDLQHRGELTLVDAREALSRFMDGILPSEDQFRGMMIPIISQRASAERRVRLYGEMVDLLWRDGLPAAAIRLEELWNGLAAVLNFNLLCAYPMGQFYKQSHGGAFEKICAAHGEVLPAESAGRGDDRVMLLRQIAVLQQRAEALNTEVAHRKELETALREALVARRRSEEALRRSERELKDFVENATVGLHWVGPDGKILWANAAELKLLGYTADEYIGRSIKDFHADEPVIDEILRRLTNNEEIHDFRARLRARDGSIRHVSINSNVLFDGGRFIHTRCFTRDITEQTRLEEERSFLLDATTLLNRSLDYQERVHDLARVVVPRLADWCVVNVATDDGRYERLTIVHGDEPEDELAARLHRTCPAPADHDPVVQVLRSGEPLVIEQVSAEYLSSIAESPEHLRRLNDLGIRSLMIVPMELNGRVLGAISLATAESGRSLTAADLPLSMELAQRAAMAMENARLYQQVQQANRAKDEFLATLSHELRTPLTAILGWARMLRSGPLDPEMFEGAIETIERSAQTQAALIDDILDLSRAVTGKVTLQTEVVDLGAVVRNAIGTVQLAASAKGVEIDFRPPSHRALVTGDPTRLQQVGWNLISNAIKFSRPGQTVTVEVNRDEGDDVRFIVRDEGIGIGPDFLPHVFEPFRQAEATSTRTFGGLGLGLAIVKYFTELHGGTVSAESAGEGLGSTFVVTLPLATRRSAREPLRLGFPADLRGTAVVLVEDDDDSRMVLAALLRSAGADVRAAASVDEGLAMIEDRTPDVIVSDIAMPGRDGYVLAQKIRSSENGIRSLPIIAVTAFGRPEEEERVMAAGFNAYVRKPVDPLQLTELIRRMRLHPA
jgi:PAS domain S-box-containing protein